LIWRKSTRWFWHVTGSKKDFQFILNSKSHTSIVLCASLNKHEL
jgi:hypothetical protein